MALNVYLIRHGEYVYEDYLTHNMLPMAEAVGIYKVIWEPREVGVRRASQVIKPLSEGLQRLQEDPERFRRLNPKNGYGDYEYFVDFVRKYLRACREYPRAGVRAFP